jgi:hypothetical protein
MVYKYINAVYKPWVACANKKERILPKRGIFVPVSLI